VFIVGYLVINGDIGYNCFVLLERRKIGGFLTLKELRESRAYTQTEVAAACQVAVNTVSNWERGFSEPRLPQIRRLAELFKVTIAEVQDAVRSSK
jgi:DNA-binding XRE family transcriptional regulator